MRSASGEPSRYAWLFTAPDATLYDGPREVAHSASPNQWQSLDDLSSISGVTTIQRVDTRGRAPPVTGCDDTHVGDEVRVPFTAEYYFYKPSAVG